MRTEMLDETGCLCSGSGCYKVGWHQYGGMCGSCWVKLTPAQRAIARGEEPPVVVEHRVEIHRARSRLLTALLWLWGAAVTAGVLYLGLKR